MASRHLALSFGICLGFATAAQTYLTPEQYASLKSHGELPADGSVALLPLASGPLPGWLLTRGGGGGCGCWVGPDETYSALPPSDDASSEALALGFSFDLFGQSYDTAFINNNGNISFGSPYTYYNGSGFPSSEVVMIAPFWADVDTRWGGSVLYKATEHALFVNWIDVGYFDGNYDLLNTFQLIITDGTDLSVPSGNVSFCYRDMQWTTGDSSGGDNGFGGSPAVVGANMGDSVLYTQVGQFNTPGALHHGPMADTSQVDWLDDRHLMFNTALGEGVPPILSISNVCDTFIIAVGEQLVLSVDGFPGLVGDQVSMTSESSAPTSWAENENSDGEWAQIVGTFTAQAVDIGLQQVTFTASQGRDENTSSLTVHIRVDLSTDITEVTARELSIAPNPATDQVTVRWEGSDRPDWIDVIAADGRVVHSARPMSGTERIALDLSTLPEGLYMVRVASGEAVHTTRLVRAAGR